MRSSRLVLPVLCVLVPIAVAVACGTPPETKTPTPIASTTTTTTAVAPMTSTSTMASTTASAVASTPPRIVGVDDAALDKSVDPCTDFYEYACGGWMKATPIPEDQPAWMRSFNVIQERNEKMLRDVLEKDAKSPPADQAYSKAIGD
jgi:hypothetical protein